MKDDRGGGLEEVQGRLLGLLDGFAHVGCEPWCSRALRRVLVAEIIRWTANRTWIIGSPARTGVVLHALHSRPVHTALGCFEGHSCVSCGRPNVSGSPFMTTSQSAFGHQ